MKIKKSNEIEELLKKINSTQESNLDFLILLRDYLYKKNDYINIEQKEKLDKTMLPLARFDIANYFVNFYSCINLKPYLEDTLKGYEINYFINNPYYQLLKDVKIDENDWKISSINIMPYEIFPCGDIIAQRDDLRIYSKLGFFKEKYTYPSLSFLEQEWMSLSPNEIKTMEFPLSVIRGKVLVLGLGLGYFIYMASIKDKVDEIHVVEMDKELINLFQTRILPKFPCAKKIHIHKAEAFSFLENIKDGEYRFIFSDLWHDYGDGLPIYIELKKIFAHFKLTTCLYWIEDSILTYFRMLVIRCILDEYFNIDNEYDEIQLKIIKALQSYKINSRSELVNFFTIGKLYKLIEKL